MYKTENFSDNVRAVFLLFIAISANFLGNTLNCGLQYDLTTTPILRQIFLYMLIIFTIDFTSKDSMSVSEILTKSLIIYIFYIMLSKQDYTTMCIVVILLISTYLCYIQTNYNIENGLDTTSLNNLTSFLMYTIGIVTIFGFLMYFNRQYSDHKDNFNYLTFFTGTNQCDKLKNL